MTARVRGDSYLEYTVNLLRPGFLVVHDSYAPGWQATVDGVDAEVVPVDFIYRATPVAKGEHRVRHEYRPRGMSTGLLLNLLGLVLVGAGVFWGRFRPQRFDLAPTPAPPPPPPRNEDGWYQ